MIHVKIENAHVTLNSSNADHKDEDKEESESSLRVYDSYDTNDDATERTHYVSIPRVMVTNDEDDDGDGVEEGLIHQKKGSGFGYLGRLCNGYEKIPFFGSKCFMVIL